MISLRDEMHELLEEFGHYGLIIRNDIFQTCKCVNELSRAADDHCPICMGTGSINKVERVLFRRKGVSSPGIMSKYLTYTSAGDISIVYTELYFDFRVRPGKNDSLVVCDWSEYNTDIPMFNEYTSIYNLDYTEPLKGDKGRIEFFMALGKTDGINQKVRLHSIKQNAGAYEYYITLRE